MKTIKDFTPEIQAKIPHYINEGLKNIFDGGYYNNFDINKARACVKWNYEKAGFKEPKVIVAENPWEIVLMYKILLEKSGEKNIKKILSSFSYNNMYLFTMNVYSNSYYQWFKFIKEEFKLSLTIEEEFETCFKLQRESGIYCALFLEDFCIVSKYPKKINRNSVNNLNSFTEDAIIWGHSSEESKFVCKYVNGVNITDDLFKKLTENKYTLNDFINEENEEIKSACIYYLQETKGDSFLIDFFKENLKEIDTYVNKKDSIYLEGTTKNTNIGVYTLFKGVVNNTSIAYVRCYCPSTDRMFFLGVDSFYNNAKDAIASLYRIPRKLVNEIESIQRQGERYSTTFTKNGEYLLKTLKQNEIEDLVCIEGEKYFKLMKYEY